MDADDERSAVPADLVATLSREPVVKFAVAFGSRVEGTARPSSDLDVAVEFVDDLSATERFHERCRCSAALQRED